MDQIISKPGLQHLAEKVFWNLDVEDLKICGQINQSCRQILDDAMFWLRKFGGLSKESQKDWVKIIQSVKSSDNENVIISYLQWNLKKEAVVDLPSYTKPAIQDDFIRNKIWENCMKGYSSDEDYEIVKLLAPLTDNPNAPNKYGSTPIHEAAMNGHTEIVKILAPLTDNPNTLNNFGWTPNWFSVNLFQFI